MNKMLDLDALERLCDQTDVWVGGESQVILTTTRVRALIQRLREAEKLLGFADIATANYRAEIEVWMDDLHKAEARITQLEGLLVEALPNLDGYAIMVASKPDSLWSRIHAALAAVEKK